MSKGALQKEYLMRRREVLRVHNYIQNDPE
jgi:hypothetical protein